MKPTLRQQLRARRAQIPSAVRTDAARQVAERLANHLGEGRERILAGYMPIGEELDIRPAMRVLAASGFRLALPVVMEQDTPLLFRVWEEHAPVIPNRYRIPEPLPSAPEATPEVLLLPCVGFAPDGARLGAGGGYYDRTLAALRRHSPPPYAIGTAFACQQIPALPLEAHDQRLDAIVTEAGTFTFS